MDMFFKKSGDSAQVLGRFFAFHRAGPCESPMATSDCAKPELRNPEIIAFTLSTEPREETAEAISPSTPQEPPLPHSRDPGGLDIAFAITPPTG